MYFKRFPEHSTWTVLVPERIIYALQERSCFAISGTLLECSENTVREHPGNDPLKLISPLKVLHGLSQNIQFAHSQNALARSKLA